MSTVESIAWCRIYKQKTADEMRISDWSSDVCSSDLLQIRQPRAQRTLCILVADDARVTGQRLRRIRQPVAVVEVADIVIAFERRQLRWAEDAGRRRIGVRPPFAGRARSVEQRTTRHQLTDHNRSEERRVGKER